MFNKLWRLLFVSVMVVLLACIPTLATKKILTVTGHWAPGGAEHTTFMASVEQYMTLNPDIVIEYTYMKTNSSSILPKLIMMYASNVMPDIVHMNNFGAVDLMHSNIFSVPPMELQSRIKRFFLPQTIDGVSFKGNVLGMPTENQVTAFYINKRMYEEAGVKAAAPATWDEWKIQMQKLTLVGSDGATQRWGTGIREPANLFFTQLFSNGGKFLEDGVIGLKSSAAIGAVSFLREAIATGWCSTGFGLGAVAGGILPSYMVRNIRNSLPDDVAAGNALAGPVPAGPNGKGTSFIYGWGVYVSGASPYQKEAWDFLEWWTMQPNENKVTRAGEMIMQLSLPSNLSDLHARPWMLSDPLYSGFMASLNDSKQMSKTYPGIQPRDAIITNWFTKALNGDVSPTEAMEMAESEIDRQIAEITAPQ